MKYCFQILLIIVGLLSGVGGGYWLFSHTMSMSVESVVVADREMGELGWPKHVRDALVKQMLHDKPKPEKWDEKLTRYGVANGGLFTERLPELERHTDLYYHADGCGHRLYIIRVDRKSSSVVEWRERSHPTLSECPGAGT